MSAPEEHRTPTPFRADGSEPPLVANYSTGAWRGTQESNLACLCAPEGGCPVAEARMDAGCCHLGMMVGHHVPCSPENRFGVPRKGVEPSRPFGHEFLRLARLPASPPRHERKESESNTRRLRVRTGFQPGHAPSVFTFQEWGRRDSNPQGPFGPPAPQAGVDAKISPRPQRYSLLPLPKCTLWLTATNPRCTLWP